MNEQFKYWLYLGFLSSFIVILFLTIFSFYYSQNPQSAPSYFFFFIEYHYFFMFLIAIIGVIFGSVTQIMTSRKIESNEKTLQVVREYFHKSLNFQERKIIEYLMENNGISTQYELSKLEGLNKLKVSRELIEMEKKGFLKKEKIGKINKIFLSKKLQESL